MKHSNYPEFFKEAKKLKKIAILRICLPLLFYVIGFIVFMVGSALFNASKIPNTGEFSESSDVKEVWQGSGIAGLVIGGIFIAAGFITWFTLAILEYVIGMRICLINPSFEAQNKNLLLTILITTLLFFLTIIPSIISFICGIILISQTNYALKKAKKEQKTIVEVKVIEN